MGGSDSSDRIAVAENWRTLLQGGDALGPADDDEDTDLVKYIGIANQDGGQEGNNTAMDRELEEDRSTADFID